MKITERTWRIYQEVGSLACATGHLDLAENMFRAALELCEKHEDMVKQKIQTLTGIADTLLLKNHIDDSFHLYKRVFNLLARTGCARKTEKWILAHVLENLGLIYKSRNHLADALKVMERSGRLLREIVECGHPQLRRVQLHIAILQTEMGNTTAASEILHDTANRYTKSIQSSDVK